MKGDKEVLRGLIEEAKNDSNVIGFFLNGSRGKNQETQFSDYDVQLVVKDKVAKSYRRKYQQKNNPSFGFSVFSISEFRKYAALGSSFEWDRASYTHVAAIIDKTGEIQKLINDKGKIPKADIKEYVAGHLDGYINHVYRSLKCFRDGNYVGARLEASHSVHSLLATVFGLEGRMTPYYKYLEWELGKYPLKKLPLKPKQLIVMLLRILKDADIKTQQSLFNIVRRGFIKEGYARIFGNWGDGPIRLIRTLKI